MYSSLDNNLLLLFQLQIDWTLIMAIQNCFIIFLCLILSISRISSQQEKRRNIREKVSSKKDKEARKIIKNEGHHYVVLNLDVDKRPFTEKQIKKAYHKQSLMCV